MTSELLKLLMAAVAQLTALQARLGIVGMELARASIARSFDRAGPADGPDERGDAEVTAAAAAIKAKMTAGLALGFASLIRTNFPDRIILEMAEAALKAARDARNEPPSDA